MRSRLHRLLLVPALLAGGIALAGCSVVDNAIDGAVSGVQDQARQLAEDAIGEALGGASISTEGELPSGFPVDDVPTIDAELIGGGGAPGGAGWAVQYRISGGADFDEAADLLEASGYTASTRDSDATSGFGTFSNGSYTVVLTAAAEPGEPTLTYVVTTDSQQSEQ